MFGAGGGELVCLGLRQGIGAFMLSAYGIPIWKQWFDNSV